jgi:hypothetical protein
VRVSVSPDLGAVRGARQAIESAFDAWERAGSADGNNAGVTFELFFEERSLPAEHTFRVTYAPVSSPRQARTWMSSGGDGLEAAWTFVDPRVADPLALSHVLAHEIGHTFGLRDCDDCAAGDSVMTRFNGDYNDTVSGRGGPSEQDNRAVRRNGGY